MFLKWGRKTKRLKIHTNLAQPCANCKSFNVQAEVFQDYFHLYWIPCFPIGSRYTIVQCDRCHKGDSAAMREFVLNNTRRRPLYLYSGSAFFLFCFTMSTIAITSHHRKQWNYVQHPKVGDVYRIYGKFGTDYYKLARIGQSDSLFFYKSTMPYLTGNMMFSPNDFFVQDEYYFSHKTILNLYEKNSVMSIEREYKKEDGYDREKTLEEFKQQPGNATTFGGDSLLR